jgi:hypothetical protein
VYDSVELSDAINRSSNNIEILSSLKNKLRVWKGRLAVYRAQLNSHDLVEFFCHLNNRVKFDRIARERRQAVSNGTRFMFRHNGQVISTREARVYLNQYPSNRLLIPHVQTDPRPEYNAFDEYGELIQSEDRRQIHTMSLNDMWDYCRQSGIAIPVNHRPVPLLTNQEAAAAIVNANRDDDNDEFDLQF